MKHIKKLALLMIAVLGMTSCDLLNVDVDTTLSGTLDVYVDEGMAKSAPNAFGFDEWTLIDYADAEEYSDNIAGLTVNEVLANVDSVSQDGVILLAGTTFYITNGVDTVDWDNGGDWPIQKGTNITLGDVESEYAEAATMIESAVTNEEDLTIGVYGESSVSGIFFSITLYFETTVEGSIF